eukprot:COSAG05_NODE_579_length_8556_cov_44.773679_10_plen_66_part_00
MRRARARWDWLSQVMRAYKMYVNISHAWFLNYRALGLAIAEILWRAATEPGIRLQAESDSSNRYG